MMRKLFVALLVGAVAVGLAAPADAADLKFSGAFRLRAQFDENQPCFDSPIGTDCSGHQFQTRFRPRFEVETEGGVRGVLYLEVGDVRFGNTAAGAGGGAGADGVNVETKWAYIDFPFPATPFRLRGGIQPFSTSKNLLLDDDGSGLSLYGKLGEADVKAWWFRANTVAPPAGGTGAAGENARDLYGIDLSLSPWKDLNLNGYLVYDHDMETTVGPAPFDNRTGTWFGAAAAGKYQNFRWDLDFIYGNQEITVAGLKADRSGVVLDGGIGTAIAGTPFDLEVRAWYGSGDKADGGDNEAFPTPYGASGAHKTGAQIWSGDPVVDISDPANNPQNTWGIGLLATWTVSPTLKFTGNFHYIGTNEEVGSTGFGSPVAESVLSGVDSVGTDIGIRADYTIARGLVFTLTASHLFLGDDTGQSSTVAGPAGVLRFDDVTKVAGNLGYAF